MSTAVEKVCKFIPNEGDWNIYIEQLEYFWNQIEFRMNRRGKQYC